VKLFKTSNECAVIKISADIYVEKRSKRTNQI